jgi:hypothetical protein
MSHIQMEQLNAHKREPSEHQSTAPSNCFDLNQGDTTTQPNGVQLPGQRNPRFAPLSPGDLLDVTGPEYQFRACLRIAWVPQSVAMDPAIGLVVLNGGWRPLLKSHQLSI